MRLRMRCDLGAENPSAAADEGARAPGEGDLQALAGLMLDAYRGTVDDEGGGISEAEEEVRRVFAGVYGPFDAAASDGAAVNATLVTEYEGKALVAFSMTAKAWQRRGLLRTMARLHSAGRKDVWLAVTEGNVAARGLYESVGFVVE